MYFWKNMHINDLVELFYVSPFWRLWPSVPVWALSSCPTLKTFPICRYLTPIFTFLKPSAPGQVLELAPALWTGGLWGDNRTWATQIFMKLLGQLSASSRWSSVSMISVTLNECVGFRGLWNSWRNARPSSIRFHCTMPNKIKLKLGMLLGLQILFHATLIIVSECTGDLLRGCCQVFSASFNQLLCLLYV